MNKEKLLLKHFDTVKEGRHDQRGGGVAILIRNDIKYRRVTNLLNVPEGLESCPIETFIDDRKVIVVSCYRPLRPLRLFRHKNGFYFFNNLTVIFL